MSLGIATKWFRLLGGHSVHSTMSISIVAAFFAGILSFFSPCTLPLFPSYVGYLSGITFHPLKKEQQALSARVRLRVFLHALCFCVGLSFLFIVLGWGVTWFGRYLFTYKAWVRLIGGMFIIAMGLFMSGVLRWDWLLRERRIQLPAVKPLGYLGSVLVGIAFAAGWTPCVGPILASVLALVLSEPAVGVWYMVAYAVGFALPFLVLALTLTSIRPLLKYTETLTRIGGWLLILMGVLLVTNKMAWIAMYLQRVTGYQGF
jgi:cytochrome c-type biogenesis protein